MNNAVTLQDIRNTVSQSGLSGSPVCIHSSFRSFGWVDGGPETVVGGFLAEGCTVMVPTFVWLYTIPPPADMRPPQNGWVYSPWVEEIDDDAPVYSVDSTKIDTEGIGAIPAWVASNMYRVRGDHPHCSFSAIGPMAEELIGGQRPLDVYAPFRSLIKNDGFVVMMGVGLTRMTILHYAENVAGRNLFRRWAKGPDGQPMMVEIGGCSGGFDKLDMVLRPIETRTKVGESAWKMYNAGQVVDLAVNAIRKAPYITHCGEPDCGRCNDAVLGGPILTGF